MYINAVVSCLGAWQHLSSNHRYEMQDIQSSIEGLITDDIPREGKKYIVQDRRSPEGRKETKTRYFISPVDVSRRLSEQFAERGWNRNARIRRLDRRYNQLVSADFSKNGIGVEISIGKAAYIESRLFVGFPYLIQANVFQTVVVLVPMMSLAGQLADGVVTFEALSALLTEMVPSPLKYRLAIIGFSEDNFPLEVIEVTTELDAYLIKTIGKTLDQMILDNEAPEFDFKENLPRNEKVSQEVCSFANMPNGGLILLGIAKNGSKPGIARGEELDDVQLKITNIVRDTCTPVPIIEHHVFGIQGSSDRVVLVTRIHEMERKPCMTNDRVYIRSGPSVRAAKPEEIRRLVLG